MASILDAIRTLYTHDEQQRAAPPADDGGVVAVSREQPAACDCNQHHGGMSLIRLFRSSGFSQVNLGDAFLASSRGGAVVANREEKELLRLTALQVREGLCIDQSAVVSHDSLTPTCLACLLLCRSLSACARRR